MIDLVKRVRNSNLYQAIRKSRFGRLLSPLFHAVNLVASGILDRLYRKRGYRIDIAGTHMQVDPSYIMITNISAEEPVLERLLEMVKPGDTFIDVGGYIGTYGIPIAMKDPSIKVITFEPSPHCAEVLREHLVYNCVSNVTLVEAACSDRTGKLLFDSNRSVLDRPSSEGKIQAADGRADDIALLEIRSTTLDDYVETNGLDPRFVKIDVEGAELQVLRGARRTLTLSKPTVFCELHKFNWSDFGCDEESLKAFLDDVGYEMRDAVTDRPLAGMPERCQVVLRPTSG